MCFHQFNIKNSETHPHAQHQQLRLTILVQNSVNQIRCCFQNYVSTLKEHKKEIW